MHTKHCQELEGPTAEHDPTTYGVNRNSIFTDSAYFHVTEGIFMHDILEGVLQLSLLMLLKSLIIQKSYFRVRKLNERIDSFCYGPIEASNKPIRIKELGFANSNDIKQSGEVHTMMQLDTVCNHAIM